MPNKESEAPMRAKLLSDKLDPKLTKSRTDMEEPKRQIPNTDRVEPLRAKLRRDNVLPKLKKSNKDREEPRRVAE
jgi:hypothetical protein